MSPERWRQVEELYHSARDQGTGILANADPELRREVQRLLARDSGRIAGRTAADVTGDATQTQIGGITHIQPKTSVKVKGVPPRSGLFFWDTQPAA